MSLRQSEFKLSPEQLIQKTKNFVSKVSVHLRLLLELKLGKSDLWLPFSLRRELLPSFFFISTFIPSALCCLGNHKCRNTRTFLRDFASGDDVFGTWLQEVVFGSRMPEVLSEDFQFIFPIVGPLTKEEFTTVFSSFKVADAFPSSKNNYFGFTVSVLLKLNTVIIYTDKKLLSMLSITGWSGGAKSGLVLLTRNVKTWGHPEIR